MNISAVFDLTDGFELADLRDCTIVVLRRRHVGQTGDPFQNIKLARALQYLGVRFAVVEIGAETLDCSGFGLWC